MADRPRYYNGILVYTAQDIHDDVAGGMDPDCLFLGLEKYDALTAELARAIRALERAGFTDHSAQEWKPPLGWGDTGKQRERLIVLEDERDELRGKLDDVRMGIGCARGQRSTQYCADLTQRDEVITNLLAMLKPKGEAMKYMLGDQKIDHEPAAHLYARACEIAGRTE